VRFSYIRAMRKTIRIVAPALATVIAAPYLSAPFLPDFDVRHAPESPPLSAIPSSFATATDTGYETYNTVTDEQIDVGQHRVISSDLIFRRWRIG